jgi:hypothetical protein
VHRLLTETPLVTLAMWRLGISVDGMNAIDTAIARGASRDPHRDVLARRAVARRDFDEAAALLETPAAPRDWQSLYFRWYVLEMAGRRAEAREFVDAHREALRSQAEAQAVWLFMQETFGTPD